MMTKCLFISASLYLAFKYRCCESKRRVNIQKRSKPVQPKQQVFWRTISNMRVAIEYPSSFCFVWHFSINFCQRNANKVDPVFEKVYTHNVYRAVTAANMLVEEEDEKTNWYLNQNIFHLGESGHDRAQQQQQLFFPPTLYLRKWDRNFFPTLFSSNFYFSSVQWRPWRGAWLAMTWLHFSSWNWLKSGETTTRFCSEFCFSFLEKRNKLECYSRYLQKQTNKPSNSLNN
jgi:hypothetical protein